MSSDDESRRLQERRKRDLYYDGLRDRDSGKMLRGAASDKAYLHYLNVAGLPQETSSSMEDVREYLEEEFCRWLAGVFNSVSSLDGQTAVDSVLLQLGMKFEIGPFRRADPLSPDSAFEQLSAKFDEQRMAVLRTILLDPWLPATDKLKPVVAISRLSFSESQDESRCKMLAKELRPRSHFVGLYLDNLSGTMNQFSLQLFGGNP